ncbi:uncharacterized protein LACBIDRAFT_307129 [Laccaria bicolor S238N-H82]|uniref:Predicted protein n=1 Tax=Laccaria bicolor (strain S238N-H82 / ATCC MYA-4686) TaxID=486041 RepID=B0E4J7_LACBS|nr:uncharacterized protein LACBIDRAFT_307129 [Laccaria bicolor S238N-H82]EDQ98234.1 predicted protein [Laccaria bicolor S238N-H82]|eukprot:XP_001891115.1 predicted protein [Laccaria bicolor S238N-H82]
MSGDCNVTAHSAATTFSCYNIPLATQTRFFEFRESPSLYPPSLTSLVTIF